jgi:hypothetical protein
VPAELGCLSRCESCRWAAGAPGGNCASFANACASNGACTTLWNCAEENCGGSACGQCTALITPAGNDAGPNPQGVNLYTSLTGCLSTTCKTSCP